MLFFNPLKLCLPAPMCACKRSSVVAAVCWTVTPPLISLAQVSQPDRLFLHTHTHTHFGKTRFRWITWKKWLFFFLFSPASKSVIGARTLRQKCQRGLFYGKLRGLALWSELSVARSAHSNLINKHFPGLFYWSRDDPSRSFSDLWRSEMLARGETKKSLNLRDSERGAFDLWENRRCLGEGIWAEGAETQLANQTGRE